ncbi:MAG: rhodanese-like domain-containing protein [Desulfamplus sp.]|nr:rhodanese-like domain-containing protein [Desulfamplus sp.]
MTTSQDTPLLEQCLFSEQFERKHYQLSVIRESAAEFGGVRNPKQILEAFLMSAQGGVGAKGGFVFLTGEDNYLFCRGIDKIEDDYIKSLINKASDHIIDKSESLPFFLDLSIVKNTIQPFTIQTSAPVLLLVSPIEDGRLVFLGLIDSLHGRDYDSDDMQLLIIIASMFQISLNSAIFSTKVELLNSQLQKKNIELDRQVFHLNALRELSLEVGEAHSVDNILSSFLPTLLGRFLRHQGVVVIYDRAAGSINAKSMGIEQGGSINDILNDPLQVDRLLFLSLAGVQNKHIQPLQVEPIIELESLSSFIKDFVPETGFLFLIKEQMYGALLLGSPLEERKFSEQERELLFASVSQSVLHIKNADSFATIVALNENLEQQNEELRKTIDELINAQNRISVLETAARRIANIVNRNADKIMKVRPLDFLLIIGISVILGLLFNFQSPRGIPIMPIPRPALVKTISVDDAKILIEKDKALLIDARPREFYEMRHAKGAVNLSPSLFDSSYPMNFENEDPERPIIIYGRSFSRLYDEDIARKFFNRDHEKIYLVDDIVEKIYQLEVR